MLNGKLNFFRFVFLRALNCLYCSCALSLCSTAVSKYCGNAPFFVEAELTRMASVKLVSIAPRSWNLARILVFLVLKNIRFNLHGVTKNIHCKPRRFHLKRFNSHQKGWPILAFEQSFIKLCQFETRLSMSKFLWKIFEQIIFKLSQNAKVIENFNKNILKIWM